MLLGLLLLGLGWRGLRYGLGFPLWGDEALLTSTLMSRDFPGMLRPLDYLQIAPLGFMWAELTAVRVLGFSEYALRAIPFLCGIASMLLFWRFAVRIADRRGALLAVAFLAASYYPVRHAAEVKPYAVDLLVSLAITYLAWIVSRNPSAITHWAGLIFLAALGPWISYPFVFVAAAAGVYLLSGLLRPARPKAIAGCILYCAVLTLSFLSMYLLYGRAQAETAPHLVTHKMWVGAFPPLERPWELPLWLIKVHTGNMMAYPIGGRSGRSALTLALVLVGTVATWRRSRRTLLLLLGPLVLTFIAAAVKRYPYGTSARVSLYMGPAFCLLGGVGLRSVLGRMLRGRSVQGGFRIAAVVLASVAMAGIVRDVVQPYKKLSCQINRSAMRWLSEQTGPADRWVIYNALIDVPHSPNLRRWGGSAARFRYYIMRFADAPVLWGPDPEKLTPTERGRTWLVVYRGKELPFDEERFASYLRSLVARLGPFERRSFDLGAPEAIEIYQFHVSGRLDR